MRLRITKDDHGQRVYCAYNEQRDFEPGEAERALEAFCVNEIESPKIKLTDEMGRDWRIIVSVTVLPGPMPEQSPEEYVTEEPEDNEAQQADYAYDDMRERTDEGLQKLLKGEDHYEPQTPDSDGRV
jgi:hypothetical protein